MLSQSTRNPNREKSRTARKWTFYRSRPFSQPAGTIRRAAIRQLCLCVCVAGILANPTATIQPLRVAAAEQAAGQSSSKYPPLDLPELEGDGGHPGISTEVQAAVLFYGVFDMERPMEDGLKDIVSQFLGGSIEDRPALYQLASPIRHISARTPPCIILYGDEDTPTIIDNSEKFADALHEAGVYRKVVIEQGRRHAYDLYEPDIDTVMQPVAQFLTTQFAIDVESE